MTKMWTFKMKLSLKRLLTALQTSIFFSEITGETFKTFTKTNLINLPIHVEQPIGK